ncbi:MAG: hypothetical protein R2764_07700 [Bacteroidales bacterium]
MDKQFKDKGYPVIAINPNDPELYPADSYEAMITRAKEKILPSLIFSMKGRKFTLSTELPEPRMFSSAKRGKEAW